MANLNFKENLKLHLDAGVKAIYIESSEWERLRDIIEECRGTNTVWFWNQIKGFYRHDLSSPIEEKNPKIFEDVLEYIRENNKGENMVYVIEFADLYLNNRDAALDFAVTLQAKELAFFHIIVLGPPIIAVPPPGIPDFLKKEFSVFDFPLPEREEIKSLLEKVEEESKLKSVDYHPKILDSVRGLSRTEIRNAFAKVATYHKKIITAKQIGDLMAEKEQIIRKTGYLEFIRTDLDMSSIGGLRKLCDWLKERKELFGEKARRANLKSPKGVLLSGIPGTGKSLCAKAAASQWGIPLLRLDMGSIYAGLVGESESNMRNAIKVAESLAPCVLWIDEIEKGLSGGASPSGELDGGTSMRVFGSLLTWMQEKEKEVFVFATANKIEKLPPEFLRKGRFDEIFFVDLPERKARESIFRSHLNKRKQKGVNIPDDLINDTKDYSGAEIEEIVEKALFKSFKDNSKTPQINAQHLIDSTSEIIPLSSTMPETIKRLRDSAKGRFLLADEECAQQLKAEDTSPLDKSSYSRRDKNHD